MLIEYVAVGEMIKSTAEGRVERMWDLATNPSDAGGYGTITCRAAGFALTAILMRAPFLTRLAARPVPSTLQRYSGCLETGSIPTQKHSTGH
jgi:hypothetical protein